MTLMLFCVWFTLLCWTLVDIRVIQCSIQQAEPKIQFARYPQLLVGQRNGNIQLIDMATGRVTNLLEDAGQITAIDNIYEDGKIFFADNKKDELLTLNSFLHEKQWITGQAKKLINIDYRVDSIACDWVNKKIYWSEGESSRIKVINADGSGEKLLLKTAKSHGQYLSLAVDPVNRYMFWTHGGADPCIGRASMDGNQQECIISKNISNPTGIAIDRQTNRIYWVDSRHEMLYSANVRGTNRKIIAKNVRGIGSLAVFGERIYWTEFSDDFSLKRITSCSKHDGTAREISFGDTNFEPTALSPFMLEAQPYVDNPCEDLNGTCSHICLLATEQPHHTCVCPVGMVLKEDKSTCEDSMSTAVFFALRSQIRYVPLNQNRYFEDVKLPLVSLRHIIALAYDYLERKLYYSQDEDKSILRSSLNRSDMETVTTAAVSRPDGMALDWLGRNLFWTDAGLKHIMVGKLNDSTIYREVVTKDMFEPRAIVVDPLNGFLFWSDWGKSAKIERADMDGANRVILVDTSISWPNGLTIDFESQVLYWADAREDVIEKISTSGDNRVLVSASRVPHVFSLSFLDGWLYKTDWVTRSLERTHKDTIGVWQKIIEYKPNIMGVVAANIDKPPVQGTTPCAHDNAGCQHFCFVRNGSSLSFCSCANGYELSEDLKTCNKSVDLDMTTENPTTNFQYASTAKSGANQEKRNIGDDMLKDPRAVKDTCRSMHEQIQCTCPCAFGPKGTKGEKGDSGIKDRHRRRAPVSDHAEESSNRQYKHPEEDVNCRTNVLEAMVANLLLEIKHHQYLTYALVFWIGFLTLLFMVTVILAWHACPHRKLTM